jgi:hypothetical protein
VTPIEAALLVVLCTLPFHYCVQRELRKLSDPDYLRKHGIVITQLRALEGHAPAIGTYMGREIWAAVTFMGMAYRFDRIVTPGERERIGPRELYLEPGLIYVTD